MRPSGAEKDWEIMKKSGMSETMQTLMRKSACVVLSLLLLLSVVLPVKAAAETAPAKVVRVGSFEDLRPRRIRSFPCERGLSLFLERAKCNECERSFCDVKNKERWNKWL